MRGRQDGHINRVRILTQLKLFLNWAHISNILRSSILLSRISKPPDLGAWTAYIYSPFLPTFCLITALRALHHWSVRRLRSCCLVLRILELDWLCVKDACRIGRCYWSQLLPTTSLSLSVCWITSRINIELDLQYCSRRPEALKSQERVRQARRIS